MDLSGERYPAADELDSATNYAEIVLAADESARQQPFMALAETAS